MGHKECKMIHRNVESVKVIIVAVPTDVCSFA